MVEVWWNIIRLNKLDVKELIDPKREGAILKKKLFYLNEERLSMNLIDLIYSVILACLLYLNGLRTSFSNWVIVLISSIFIAKAIYAAYRIIKYSKILKSK